MTAPVIACDVSEHQGKPADDTYPHDWLIFRACFGAGYTDRLAAQNLAWAVKARADGRLRGFTAYVVYLPGENAGVLAQLDRLGVPRDCPIMVDAEHWGGESYQIDGDHSPDINNLAAALRKRQGGRADLVWAYGNRGPDLAVWPSKPTWCGWLVASYGGSKPDVPNLAGWQYTNGQYTVPGLPSSSAPFGACDHNVLYQLADSGGVLMALTDQQQADLYNRVMGFLSQRWYAPVKNDDGTASLKIVPQGTPGAVPCHALDTMDGNYLATGIAGLLARVSDLQAKHDELAAELAQLKASGALTLQPGSYPATVTVTPGGTQ